MARRDLCDAGPVIVGSSNDDATNSGRQPVAQGEDAGLASLVAGTVRVPARSDGSRPARNEAMCPVHEGMEPRFPAAPPRITNHAVASNPP